MNLNKNMEGYLSWCEINYSHGTFVARKGQLNRFNKYLNEHELGLSIESITRFQQHLRSLGLAPQTLRTHTISIRGLLDYMKKSGNKEVKPLLKLINVPKNEIRESYPPITCEDADKLCLVFKGDNFRSTRNRLIFRLLFCTGMRVGELLSTTMDKIDFEKREIRVKTEKQRGSKSPFRTVYWDDVTDRELKRYLAHRESVTKVDHLLVGETSGLPLRYNILYDTFTTAVYKSGIGNDKVLHSFRHGFGKLCAENNMPLNFLQKLMGHSDISSTMVYCQADQEKIRSNHQQIFSKSKTYSFPQTVLA